MSNDRSKPSTGTQIAGSGGGGAPTADPSGSSSASMPQAEAPSLVGEVLDGRYKIMKKLGEGGMGEVYAAEHVHIEKHVAIKLLKAEIVSNKEAVSRFRQEARSASSIGHKNIIGIDDFGVMPDGRIYLCMELLNGQALNDMIQQPMPPERLLNIMIQTGHGLAAAHAKGIVHRDMKPENIFVTVGPSGEDIPKLLDFGIAKVAGHDGQNNLTRTGTIFGTPFYMAPEQALGQQVDARVDIYAMGVILYELFAGSLPFRGDSFMGILTQHITTEPEPVMQRAMKAGRSLPPGLADVIGKAMQKDPDKRYRSMDELVAALVEVYRALAGPGMSTYMQAYQGGGSGMIGAQGSQPYQVPGMPPTGVHPAATPGHMLAPGSQPNMMPAGMPHPTPPPMGYAPSPFAPDSSSVALPQGKKSSKAGLIFLLIALVVVGAGVAVFLVVNGNDSGSGTGSGTASGTATGTGTGTASGVASGTASGTDTGSQQASGTGTGTASGTDTEAAVISVTINSGVAGAHVFDGKKDLGTAPQVVRVIPGEPMDITVKAKGYKDLTKSVDGQTDSVAFDLTKVVIKHGGNGSGSAGSNSQDAIKKYCQEHPEDLRCQAE
jgi:serine/threonine protein kinase